MATYVKVVAVRVVHGGASASFLVVLARTTTTQTTTSTCAEIMGNIIVRCHYPHAFHCNLAGTQETRDTIVRQSVAGPQPVGCTSLFSGIRQAGTSHSCAIGHRKAAIAL
eukprot:COSAG05_NODE_6_length_45604_cov_26.489660_13_plen_110_part_00